MNFSRLRAGTWSLPLLVGALSAIGLITALVDEGGGDWFAWAALTLPVAIGLHALRPTVLRRSPTPGRKAVHRATGDQNGRCRRPQAR